MILPCRSSWSLMLPLLVFPVCFYKFCRPERSVRFVLHPELSEGNSNLADWFSRFPQSDVDSEVEDKIYDYVNFVQNSTPIDFQVIQKATKEDRFLERVKSYIIHGWPNSCKEDNLRAYFVKKDDLFVDSEVVMWGYRMVIPSKCRVSLLEELHATHMGASKMKSLARSYFWWPCIDEEIEKFAKNCSICLSLRPNPSQVQSKWPESSSPFQRVHVDFLELKGVKYLILTDSYSRWPELVRMSRTDVDCTMDALREIFARFGIPNTLVSDNGPPFQSGKFQTFCLKNKICHITTPPYHPKSNGAAEIAVKTFKVSLAKMSLGIKSSDVSSLVSRYLLTYRNTPHWVTERTPSELFLGRKVRTPFDFIKEGDSIDKQGAPDSAGLLGRRQVSFCSGEKVYVRCYQDQSRVKWVKGTIVKKIGKVVYLVRLDDGAVVKRHLDQIVQYDSSENCSSRALLFDDLDVSQPANTDTNVPSDSDVLQPTDRDTIDSHDGDAIDSHDSNVSLTSPSNDTPSLIV
uniref:RNA-directed DNA polymerase n=1 Tax=Cacopsylla melanoneura TaxID=428564 RepID=A0A8D8U302_9HEMI